MARHCFPLVWFAKRLGSGTFGTLVGISILASDYCGVVMSHHTGMAPERPWRVDKSQIHPGIITRARQTKADVMFFCQTRKLCGGKSRSDFMAEVFDIPPAKPKHYRKLDQR